MRINSNLTTLNTHRYYGLQTNNVSKYAERIASGRRINRAADDAAGLAIAEKLLSQITGTNMATRNSQDAISLVQTAEGGLQGTQDILQRMEELAVQAATGTNQRTDRTALAKEFEQLKNEINDISGQTTFNNMPVLDGSMSPQGYQRSAQSAGITIQRQDNLGSLDASGGARYTSDARTGSESSTLRIADASQIQDGNTLTVGGRTLTVQNGGTGANEINWDGTGGMAGFAQALQATLGSGYNVTQTGDAATSGSISIEGATGTTAMNSGLAAAAGAAQTATPTAATDVGHWSQVSMTDADVQAGMRLTANGTTYAITDATHQAAAGEVSLDAANVNSVDSLIAAVNANDATVTASRSAEGMTMRANGAATAAGTTADLRDTGVSKVSPGTRPANTGTTATSIPKYTYTMEFDPTKMKDGDTFSVRIDGQERSFTYDAAKYRTDATGSAASKIATDVAQSFGMDNVYARGGAVLARTSSTDVSATLPVNGDATKVDASSYPTAALRGQVGALENEQMSISIGSMNTTGLGLDGISLDTQESAGQAITAVRNAINQVSDQRATLGASQNRLEHKISNLKVAAENQTAAESRIRDADIAEQMTNLIRTQILQKASTSMLAHGNQLTQNVLGLLRT